MEFFLKTFSLILPSCSVQICPGLSGVFPWKLYNSGPAPPKQPSEWGLQAFHHLGGGERGVISYLHNEPYTQRLVSHHPDNYRSKSTAALPFLRWKSHITSHPYSVAEGYSQFQRFHLKYYQ